MVTLALYPVVSKEEEKRNSLWPILAAEAGGFALTSFSISGFKPKKYSKRLFALLPVI